MFRHALARVERAVLRAAARSRVPAAVRPRVRPCARAALAMGATLGALLAPAAAGAQYFGRNKVNYETFDFRTLTTPRFDVLYYPIEETAARDAGRMAERWYTRLSPFMRHEFGRKTLIFFADQPDFQQNNVTDIESEGTGGVTESFRQRVIMPFTGVYADNHHVLGHELVHVFQYDIANAAPGGGLQRMNQLPLWLIEGMAEYLSLGRADVNTATWLRDAARRNDVPTIKQLNTDPRYFPYRYGQALWAYVGGRWGDQAVVDVYRNALRYGFEGAIRRVLDVSTDQLSKDWKASIVGYYKPLMAGRTAPDSTATLVIGQRTKRGGEYNIAPAVSPDGRYIAFFSSRGLFDIDLYIADAQTGRVVKQLGSLNRARHFDALSFIASSGTWSPDAKRIAYVVYQGGNQVIQVYNVETRSLERTLKTPDVGAALDPAWSPDGGRIAFSGNRGGISDLYVYDLATNRVDRLTDGREAELQPAWSPDGRTLAFVTDRGPGTDFERMTFSPVRLATMDVATREIRLLTPFTGARHINPYFAPDGRSLYFIADPDGFSDLYRMDLGTGQRYRVTRTATGIAGITSLSPALSVARQSGRVVFSVFDHGGYNIARFEAEQAQGTPVEGAVATAPSAAASGGVTPGATPGVAPPASAGAVPGAPAATAPATGALADGGLLPPPTPQYGSAIERYLADAPTGLPTQELAARQFATKGYNSGLRLDFIAPPTVGVTTSSAFGTGFAGGIAGSFSDNLGNKNLVAVVQANGQVQDIGGQVFFQNTRRRWNWALGAGHIPYLTGFTYYDQGDQTTPPSYNQILQRIFLDQVTAISQYPLNTTQRLEFSVAGTRQGYGIENYQIFIDQFGNAIGDRRQKLPAPPSIYYAQASAGFVGDYSYNGYVGPIAGGRYRFEVTPTVGQLRFTQALADYRRYFFARPVTFAFRGLHFGRYGGNAEDSTLIAPLYAGYSAFARGYDVANNLQPNECAGANANRCPVFDRMLGSRFAVANAELRIPLLGGEALGLIRTNIVPVEIAPFFDAAVAWTASERPDLRWVSGEAAKATASRIPVFSTGVTARVNLLGFAVVEAFYAYPFQRPDRRGKWGFQLAPGW